MMEEQQQQQQQEMEEIDVDGQIYRVPAGLNDVEVYAELDRQDGAREQKINDMNQASHDKLYNSLGNFEKFAIGAGKQASDVWEGGKQLFAEFTGDEEGAQAIAENKARSDAIFKAMDERGVGAEDAGQFIAEGMMLAAPGSIALKAKAGYTAAGAIAASILGGMKSTDETGEDALKARAVQATIDGGMAAVGGVVGGKVVDIVTAPVKTLLGTLTLGSSNKLFNGLAKLGGKMSRLKQSRAQNFEGHARAGRTNAMRMEEAKLGKENRDGALAIWENEILPIIQGLNSKGREDLLDYSGKRFQIQAGEALKSPHPVQGLQDAWNQSFGMYGGPQLRRSIKDGGFGKVMGAKIENMGIILAKHKDQYSPELLADMMEIASRKVTDGTDATLVKLGAAGVSESSIRKYMQSAGSLTLTAGVEAIQ